MAIGDDTPQSGTDTIATDHVTTLNGAAVTQTLTSPKVQRVKVGYGDDGTHRDASTLFPLPTTLVSSGGLPQVSGTLSALGANTPGTPSITSGAGQVVASTALAGNATFHLVTSAFVGTVIFEASVDGGANYAPIVGIREDGNGAEIGSAITTAVAFIRQYTVALPGYLYFRVRCSAYTSGTMTVLIAPGPTLFEPTPSLGNSIANIGNVTLNNGLSTIGNLGELRAGNATLSATGAAGAAVTLTIPAGGASTYITALDIVLYSAAARTGAATPWVVTTTNFGGLAWTFSTAGAIGTTDPQSYRPVTPTKAVAVATAVTIVAPAATGGIWRINASYFQAL